MDERQDQAISRTVNSKQRVPLLMLLILLPLMILLPHPLWNTLFLAIFGIYALSYIWIQALRQRLHAKRERQRQWLSVGDELVERFSLTNQSFLPAAWIELHDESNVPGYRPSVAYMLLPWESVGWRQAAVCIQRGHFFVGPWQLRTGDPFGFFELVINYGVEDDLLIYPPITTNIPFGLPTGLQHGQTTGQEMINQVTQNISTVREYRMGDPMRWIHWPTTARRNRLVVREFDIDASGEIWILLDLLAGQHLGSGVDGTEEQAILIASALVAQGLANNRAMGLAIYGPKPEIIHPQKGMAQQWKILYALAVAQANGDLSLSESISDLKSIMNRGSALIVITPKLKSELLPEYSDLISKEIHPTTILFDRASFGASPEESDAEPLFAQLPNHRFYKIYQGDISSQAASDEAQLAYRVTPMGGVVRSGKGPA